MSSYEAHITYDRKHADYVIKLSERTGWKFSQIDGDPVLGHEVRCYLTHYDVDAYGLLHEMNDVVYMSTSDDIPHLRRKIERIIFDSVTGIDQLSSELL